MAQINNTELLTGMRNTAKIVNAEPVATQLGQTVVPTLETNPKFFRYVNKWGHQTTTNVGGVLLTTPTNADFYLTFASLSRIKDATSDDTDVGLSIYLENGSVAYICELAGITLTAQSQDVAINFNPPIKLKRGTAISSFDTSTTVGVQRLNAVAMGYFVPD